MVFNTRPQALHVGLFFFIRYSVCEFLTGMLFNVLNK